MKTSLILFSPYILLFLGLFLLLFMGQVIAAGVCLLLGIVMIIERIWPEKWGNLNSDK